MNNNIYKIIGALMLVVGTAMIVNIVNEFTQVAPSYSKIIISVCSSIYIFYCGIKTISKKEEA